MSYANDHDSDHAERLAHRHRARQRAAVVGHAVLASSAQRARAGQLAQCPGVERPGHPVPRGGVHDWCARPERAGPAPVDDAHRELPRQRGVRRPAAPRERRQAGPGRHHREGSRDPPRRPSTPRRLAGPAPARAHPRRTRPPAGGRPPDPEIGHFFLSPTFRSLRNHNYRLYATGGVVSNTGTWMQRVAQDWLVVLLAHNDGVALGITTGLQFLPALLLSPYAGLIADRMPKLRLLKITQSVMAVTALLLGALAVTGAVQVWHVFVLAFVFGVGSAFDAPARQSFVSEMVGPDDLSNAVGLNSASFNAARLAGPAIAGLLIGLFGGGVEATGWVIVINGFSYGAVLLALRAMVPADLHTPERAPRHKGQIRDAIRYLRGRPDLMLILCVVGFA